MVTTIETDYSINTVADGVYSIWNSEDKVCCTQKILTGEAWSC